MSGEADKRRFSRFPMEAVVRFDHSGALLRGQVENISLKGAAVRTHEQLRPGTRCRLELIPGEGRCEPLIVCRARVLRSTATGIALEFTEFGFDSYRILRDRLMLLSEDPETIEKEDRIYRQAG